MNTDKLINHILNDPKQWEHANESTPNKMSINDNWMECIIESRNELMKSLHIIDDRLNATPNTKGII